MRRAPLATDIDAAIIARGTPGFSGADLANLNNEVLFAARGNKRVVSMVEFEKAKDQNHDGRRTSLHGDDGSAERVDRVSRSGPRLSVARAGTRSGAQSVRLSRAVVCALA